MNLGGRSSYARMQPSERTLTVTPRVVGATVVLSFGLHAVALAAYPINGEVGSIPLEVSNLPTEQIIYASLVNEPEAPTPEPEQAPEQHTTPDSSTSGELPTPPDSEETQDIITLQGTPKTQPSSPLTTLETKIEFDKEPQHLKLSTTKVPIKPSIPTPQKQKESVAEGTAATKPAFHIQAKPAAARPSHKHPLPRRCPPLPEVSLL